MDNNKFKDKRKIWYGVREIGVVPEKAFFLCFSFHYNQSHIIHGVGPFGKGFQLLEDGIH